MTSRSGLRKGLKVGLVEIYAGLGNLSQAFEDCQEPDDSQVQAIRLGHRWGQELRSKESRWFIQGLLALCKPDDVWVAFPCKAHCKWNQFNEHKSFATRQKVLQERLKSWADLQLLFEVIEAQVARNRAVHAENPEGSLAWRDPRFKKLKGPHAYVTFDQCALGLKHPRTGRPVKTPPTTVFSTSNSLLSYLSAFRCSHQPGRHSRIEGSYQGRAISSWMEDYNFELSRAIIRGLSQTHFSGFGQAHVLESEFEPPFLTEQCERLSVEKCWLTKHNEVVPLYADPAVPEDKSIFKITDDDM